MILNILIVFASWLLWEWMTTMDAFQSSTKTVEASRSFNNFLSSRSFNSNNNVVHKTQEQPKEQVQTQGMPSAHWQSLCFSIYLYDQHKPMIWWRKSSGTHSNIHRRIINSMAIKKSVGVLKMLCRGDLCINLESSYKLLWIVIEMTSAPSWEAFTSFQSSCKLLEIWE